VDVLRLFCKRHWPSAPSAGVLPLKPKTAEYCYTESLAIRRAIDDRWGIAGCLSNLGWVAHLQDDYATARAFYEESLVLSRTIGDRRGMAIVLTNLGFTLAVFLAFQ
jgi:hypothetical protein